MSDSSLQDLWEASAGHPFQPTIGKGTQFTVGFSLLLFAFVLSSLFGLSMRPATPSSSPLHGGRTLTHPRQHAEERAHLRHPCFAGIWVSNPSTDRTAVRNGG